MRRKSRKIRIGNSYIGGDSKISVQSMLKYPSSDIENNVLQAKKLENSGCQILRVSIPDKNSLVLIDKLKNCVDIPIVADIHFDFHLAIDSVFAGADKIRINPGNICKDDLKKIIKVCKQRDIPVRIGVNSGSVEKDILNKFNNLSEAILESAISNIRFFESLEFDRIVLSLKSSDVLETIFLYEKIAKMCDYPLHIGLTEAGTKDVGIVKSCIAIGSLLSKGIGDTIRVSLTEDPVYEVETGLRILKSLHLYDGVEIISCPTCGRTTINVELLSKSVEELTKNIKKNIKIAVMGCPVNGPGESKNADLGITAANGIGIIFSHGKILRKVPQDSLVDELSILIKEFVGD